MNLINLHFEERETNPMDLIEVVAALHDWMFERSGDDEITISVGGGWAEYHVSFSWMAEVESLHLACSFDCRARPAKSDEIARLLALVNEQMLGGHFDFWDGQGQVIYRHSLLLAGGLEPTTRQVEALLAGAVDACERYFQAFQFVLWAGKDAKDALACALFETEGEA